MRRFEPGEVVALRENVRDRIWTAIPAHVVEDTSARRVFHIAPRTIFRSPRGDDGSWLRLPTREWSLEERAWDPVEILSFAVDGIACGFLLMRDPEGQPVRWYLNLESPLRRSPVGFDYTDHVLDVIVELDGSWRWKDEDELREAVRLGLFTQDEASSFYRDGERAVAMLRDHEPPFDRDWSSWQPDSAWPPPRLPEGWDLY